MQTRTQIRPAPGAPARRDRSRRRRGCLGRGLLGRGWLSAAVIAASVALMAVIAGPAFAQDPAQERAVAPDAETAERIQAVIEGQISAFLRDDGEGAFAYAAPDIRDIFENSERFMAMVRRGFMPVYRPQEFSFGDALISGDDAAQRVRITGEDGVTMIAVYQMTRQSDGGWLISGVSLFTAPDQEI